MISMPSDLLYRDRGRGDLMALIPGWASDHRIFSGLDLPFDYVMPKGFFSPSLFEQGLLEALRENRIRKVALFGWSLGAFLASEFASRHPGMIERLILVSARKRYDAGRIDTIKSYLKKSKSGYLYKFYSDCFPDKARMRSFRQDFLNTYVEELQTDYLCETLDYLKDAQIKPELLRDIRQVTIMHGEFDKIAPLEEAREISKSISHAHFILMKETGHMPFFDSNFKI